MRDLSRAAQLYLIACYLLGLGALGWLIGLHPELPTRSDWLLGAALAVLATAAQLFVVDRGVGKKAHYADHLTPAPIFAAVLLLPPPLLAGVVVIAFVAEWLRYRRVWYIHLFNTASWLVAAALGRWTLLAVTGESRLQQGDPLPVWAIALAGAVFLLAQTLLLAWALLLARGQSLAESGLLDPRKLFPELALLCAGWAFAAAWTVDPLYAAPAAIPLLVFFQALHIPNLREQAATDPKTGLANMRHFNASLLREIERAERNNQPLSLLMCDLDYLRNINNTYGHQAGDRVLHGVADAIRHGIRSYDVAGRFGGEEFVVLLTETDGSDALLIGERLRAELEGCRFPVGLGLDPIRATLSIGVAAYPADGRSADALLREADLAVYQAKREGRNRVVAAGRASRELAGEWAREHFVPSVVSSLTRPASPAPIPAARSSGSLLSDGTTRPAAGQTRPLPWRLLQRASQQGQSSPLVFAFIGAVVVAGLAAVLPGLLTVKPMSFEAWLGLALFSGLVILTQQLAVDIDGRGKTSVAVVAMLGMSFLYAEPGILAAALAFAVWAKLKARSPLHRMLFNFGMALLGLSLATWSFTWLVPDTLPADRFAWMTLPAALAGLVYYAINHLLICSVRGLVEQRNPWQIWRADYQWLWPHYMVMGVLGLVIAMGYQAFGWAGLVALSAPIGMMHLAIKQYMERTAVYVAELRRMNGRLSDSYEATLQALSHALDTRDEETEEHSRRVRHYTELIARHLGLSEDEIEHISRGALLHDIGKIGVPDAILLKPGQLTDEERDLMRKHPTIGFAMIAHIPFLAKAAEVVLHHHEAYDGSGYPSGLVGEQIPVGARIFAVADAFDAMTSDRPYRKARSYVEAFAEIERCQGTQFDPRVVDILMAISLEELQACSRTDSDMDVQPAALLQRQADFVAV